MWHLPRTKFLDNSILGEYCCKWLPANDQAILASSSEKSLELKSEIADKIIDF